MADIDAMNVSGAEFLLNEADDLLMKACVNEKGQKTLVKMLASQRREEIVNDCSVDAALKAICNRTFLATPDGRKLGRDLIRKVGIEKAWKAIRISVKNGIASKNHCIFIGQTLISLWKKLEKADEDTSELERIVFEDLFRCAVVLERKYSEKFLLMVDGLVAARTVPVLQVVYRNLASILWQALDAPNMICRFNAAMVFFHVFPLVAAPEQELDFDIREKQFETFLALLKDDCFAIRVEAVKTLFNALGLYWPMIKNQHRKAYLTTMIDELVYDEVVDVRLAVYESFPQLYVCGGAVTVVEHTLKLLAPSGLNDPKDKVRLAAVKMIKDAVAANIAVEDIVTKEELFACLDVEGNEQVEDELIKLMFMLFHHEENSGPARFKNTEELCKTSRRGALKYHARLVPLKLIDDVAAATYIKNVIVFALQQLRPIDRQDEDCEEGDDTQMDHNESKPRVSINFIVYKTILDSMVTMFLTIRNTLVNIDPNKFKSVLTVLGKFVTRILDGRLKGSILRESALIAASFLPACEVPNAVTTFKRFVETGDIDDSTMNYYVQTYAMWDMQQLIYVIKHGLHSLAKTLGLEKKMPKWDKNLQQRNVLADKTPSRERKAIELIAMTLAFAPTNAYLLKEFASTVLLFYKILKILMEAFPPLFDNSKEALWIRIYEVYSMLKMTISSQVAAKDPNFCDQENNSSADPDEDSFGAECSWFMEGLQRNYFTETFVSKFISLAICHFECNQQSDSTCEQIVELSKLISTYLDSLEKPQNLRKKLRLLEKTAFEASHFAKAERPLAIIPEDDEEHATSQVIAAAPEAMEVD